MSQNKNDNANLTFIFLTYRIFTISLLVPMVWPKFLVKQIIKQFRPDSKFEEGTYSMFTEEFRASERYGVLKFKV